MMGPEVCAFGLALKPLSERDLPLMLHWRTHPEIAPYMDDDRHPGMAELRFWFKRAQRSPAMMPFVMYDGVIPVGFMEFKDIRLDMSSCVSGRFMYGNDNRGKGFGRRAMLCGEIVMRKYGLTTFRNSIRHNNKVSLNFFQRYRPVLEGRDSKFMYFVYEYDNRMKGLRLDAEKLGCLDEFKKRFE